MRDTLFGSHRGSGSLLKIRLKPITKKCHFDKLGLYQTLYDVLENLEFAFHDHIALGCMIRAYQEFEQRINKGKSRLQKIALWKDIYTATYN